MSSNQRTPNVQSTSPVGPDGVVRCKHGEPALKRTSQTALNPNRDFWCCRYPPGDNARCKFFYWADDPIVKERYQVPSTTQQWRTEPPISESPTRSKRLEDIQRGLQERHASQSSSETAVQSPGSSPHAPTGSIDWEQEPPSATPTHRPYSFLGLYSPSVGSPVEDGASPVTPQKRRRHLDDDDDDDEDEHSILLTPPETVHRPGVASTSFSGRPDPVTPTRNKGKERAFDSGPGLAQNEDNPFIEGPSIPKADRQPWMQRAGSTPQLSYSPGSSSSSEMAPTPAEQIAAIFTQVKQDIGRLQTTVEQLEQLGSLEYVLRIERQKTALSISNEAKKKRITELVAEVDDLRNQVRQ
ncbi:hypothetical protein J3A83DRAFT_4234637 [Scleroderma citrinum]